MKLFFNKLSSDLVKKSVLRIIRPVVNRFKASKTNLKTSIISSSSSYFKHKTGMNLNLMKLRKNSLRLMWKLEWNEKKKWKF